MLTFLKFINESKKKKHLRECYSCECVCMCVHVREGWGERNTIIASKNKDIA